MIIAIGTDHHGVVQKEIIKEQFSLPDKNIQWYDSGSFNQERVDYPYYAIKVARAVQEDRASSGILLCGSGVGMSIAANRFKGIYAAVVWNEELARKAKEDDNANILVIPSDYVSDNDVIPMLNAWISARFKEGRYQERLNMIDILGGVL